MADVMVKDIMTRLVVRLYPDDGVKEAAERLAANGISGAPVVEDGKVVGIVSEADLIRSLAPPAPVDRGTSVFDALELLGAQRSHGLVHGTTVREVMSPFVVQIPEATSIWKAASIMERRGVKRLPVVDGDDNLIGIVSRADLVKTMARDDDQIRRAVMDAVWIVGEETIQGLDATVVDGVVTLRGIADRKTTHDLAVKLAGRTPGVVEVVDRMSFEWDDTHVKVPSSVPDPRENWQNAAGM